MHPLHYALAFIVFLFAGARAQESGSWESSYSSARVLQISGRVVSWTPLIAFAALAIQDKEEDYKWLVPVAMAGVPLNGIGATGMARAVNRGGASPKAEATGWGNLAVGSGVLVLGTAGIYAMETLDLDNSEKFFLGMASLVTISAGVVLYGISWYQFSGSADRIAEQRSSLVLAPQLGYTHGALAPGLVLAMSF